MKTRHNPEHRAWRGRSYKKGGAPIRSLREAFETHEGVTLERVRVVRDVFFADGRLKAQAGAIGHLASEFEGRGCVTFEYGSGFVEKDGSGRPIAMIDLVDLERTYGN